MMSIVGKIKYFDAYSKPLEDFRIRTSSGGAVTVVSSVIMALLFMVELRDYLKPSLHEELFVDTSRGDTDRVKINFDVTFPKLACDFISVDAMDVSGEQQSDVQHNVWKIRLDENGNAKSSGEKHEVGGSVSSTVKPTTAPTCGSCYGAESETIKCCNSCDDVRLAYKRKGWALMDTEDIAQCADEGWNGNLGEHKDEGCRLHGYIEVAKVAGNFHIAPGHVVSERHAHVHDLHSVSPEKFDTSHFITHFSFGDSYPGKSYPLDKVASEETRGGIMFQYFVKIVPTIYQYLDPKSNVLTHQFSVTKHKKSIGLDGESGLPGFFVMYEFSPLMVKLTEDKKSFTSFITSVCAIIGGVFTVASLLDAFIYHSAKALQKKIELGKAI